MSWKDLLKAEKETLSIPWVGGRSFQTADRKCHIEGALPPEHGWHRFEIDSSRTTRGRKAHWSGPCEPCPGSLCCVVRGYMVGDRLVPDDTTATTEPARVAQAFEKIHLVEAGLDRFVRVKAGRLAEGEPLVYLQQEFPLGPEEQVLQAFLDQEPTIEGISGVAPALHAAFHMETWQRAEAQKRREEAERRRREEEARQVLEEQRRQQMERLGTAEGRRQLARTDFEQAAKAALAVGGATYLDHRPAANRAEMVVRFRFLGRRFECTCDARTLQIIDAGICLTAHDDDSGFEEGTRGDTFFTLESLPGVIREADQDKKLVVFRHVD
jgi:hypothetical protein